MKERKIPCFLTKLKSRLVGSTLPYSCMYTTTHRILYKAYDNKVTTKKRNILSLFRENF